MACPIRCRGVTFTVRARPQACMRSEAQAHDGRRQQEHRPRGSPRQGRPDSSANTRMAAYTTEFSPFASNRPPDQRSGEEDHDRVDEEERPGRGGQLDLLGVQREERGDARIAEEEQHQGQADGHRLRLDVVAELESLGLGHLLGGQLHVFHAQERQEYQRDAPSDGAGDDDGVRSHRAGSAADRWRGRWPWTVSGPA